MKGQNKTEVFILVKGYDYDGSSIIGAYATHDIAVKMAKTVMDSERGWGASWVEAPESNGSAWRNGSTVVHIEKHKVMEK